MVFMKIKCNKAGKACNLKPITQEVLNKRELSSLKNQNKELDFDCDSSTMDQDFLPIMKAPYVTSGRTQTLGYSGVGASKAIL